MQPAALVGRVAGQHARDRLGHPAQGLAPGHLVAQDGPASLAIGGPAAAGLPDQDRMAQHPGDRAEVGQGLALLLGDQEVRRAQQRPGEAAADYGQHGAERQVDGEHVQRPAPVEQAQVAAPDRGLPHLPGGQVAVVDHRIGHHADLVAGRMDSPAEVDIVTEQGQVGVEPAHLVPYVAADQHARRAHRQHLPVAVVLALVDLAGLDPGEAPSRAVDGDPRLAQHAPVGQVLQLRAEHCRRPAAAGHPEHLLQRVGGRLAVIVQQPDPLHGRLRARAGRYRQPARGGVLQGAGHRSAVTGIGIHAEDHVGTDQRAQRGPAAVQAAGIDPDDLVHGVGLFPYSVDQPRQQPGTVVHDNHSRDDVTEVRCVLGQGSCQVAWATALRAAACPA